MMAILAEPKLFLIFIHGNMVIVLRRIWFGGDIRAVGINLQFNFIGELL